MPPKPTATTRRYIHWPPHPPTEPTSTLVLTSPSGHFIDIRVQISARSSQPHAPLSLPLTHQSLFKFSAEFLPQEALDWAFAGHAKSTAIEGGREHCKWTHTIDSRTPHAAGVRDEGIIQPKRDIGFDGNEYDWEREEGEMDDGTGEVKPYEEGWLSIPALFGQRQQPKGEEGQVIQGRKGVCKCVVLELDSEASDRPAKALIVRVGDWMQAVWRCGDEFAATRCLRFTQDRFREENCWACVLDVGGMENVRLLKNSLNEFLKGGGNAGESFRYEGLTWNVKEVWESGVDDSQ